MADKEIIIGRVINVTGMVGVSAGIVSVATRRAGRPHVATFRCDSPPWSPLKA